MVPRLFVPEEVVLEFVVANSKKEKEIAWGKIERNSARFKDDQIQRVIDHDTVDGHFGRYARKATRILNAREDRKLRDGSAAKAVAYAM